MGYNFSLLLLCFCGILGGMGFNWKELANCGNCKYAESGTTAQGFDKVCRQCIGYRPPSLWSPNTAFMCRWIGYEMGVGVWGMNTGFEKGGSVADKYACRLHPNGRCGAIAGAPGACGGAESCVVAPLGADTCPWSKQRMKDAPVVETVAERVVRIYGLSAGLQSSDGSRQRHVSQMHYAMSKAGLDPDAPCKE